jgi:hypothetical protein
MMNYLIINYLKPNNELFEITNQKLVELDWFF